MAVIQRFFDGHPLYDGAFTHFGPLYYLYEYVPHVLTGSPITHDGVRAIAVVFRVITGLLLFLLIWRVTGSLVVALAAHYVGFHALSFLAAEAVHPQELCILLLVALALAACARPPVAAACFGILVACLALTKINIGILAAAAAGELAALAAPYARRASGAVCLPGRRRAGPIRYAADGGHRGHRLLGRSLMACSLHSGIPSPPRAGRYRGAAGGRLSVLGAFRLRPLPLA